MKGPTIWRWAAGNARRTMNGPMSRSLGMMIVSMASAAVASPSCGSGRGRRSMAVSSAATGYMGKRPAFGQLLRVERRGADRLAVGIEADAFHPSLGLGKEPATMLPEGIAALID